VKFNEDINATAAAVEADSIKETILG